MSHSLWPSWGRTTYVVVAASRTFADAHPRFVEHFVSVASRIADSFIDYLGSVDPQNTLRWEAKLLPTSLIPSLVDALMLKEETPMNPSEDALFDRRAQLDLFVDNDADTQLSCQHMGSGLQSCSVPTTQHWSLVETAEFLVNQKTLSNVGVMANMGDDSQCFVFTTFCGGDIIDGSFLSSARRDCLNCKPVGPYAQAAPRASSTRGEPDDLLRALEGEDIINGRSPYSDTEVGRVDGDSNCLASTLIASNSPVTGTFGDGANGIDGQSYSDDLSCEWEIRGVDCEGPSDSCNSLVELNFEVLRVWSGDLVRIYADPDFRCKSDSPSSHIIAQATGFDELPPTIRAQGCLRVVFETDLNVEKSYAVDAGDGFVLRYNRDSQGCSSETDCNGNPCVDGLCKCGGELYGADCLFGGHCFGTSLVALVNRQPTTIASHSSITSSGVLQADLSNLADPKSLEPGSTYPNDALCNFEIEVPPGSDFVEVKMLYDVSLLDVDERQYWVY